jgi:hypothetical protein
MSTTTVACNVPDELLPILLKAIKDEMESAADVLRDEIIIGKASGATRDEAIARIENVIALHRHFQGDSREYADWAIVGAVALAQEDVESRLEFDSDWTVDAAREVVRVYDELGALIAEAA